jgi:ABC-2 type transport system ATP-binding protein
MSSDAQTRLPLVVSEVHKSYGDVKALAGVDLQIPQGEIVALLGANGAGKTTLVSIATGLLSPDSGDVWVDGVNVLTHGNQARQRLGLAPQDTGIYPTIPVRENLRFFGELVGLRRAALEERVEQIADAFGLSALMDRQARTLSGGEARRLHTAMVLLHRPPLLLLDEPTTGVDVRTRSRLLDVVRTLAEEGSAICYSTHYLGEVEQLGNASIAILDQGHIVTQGTLTTLIGSYGQSAVELRFNGPPPSLSDGHDVQIMDHTLLVSTNREPALELATLLNELGDATQRLQAVRLVQPSLESVFLAVTGQPLHDSDQTEDEP